MLSVRPNVSRRLRYKPGSQAGFTLIEVMIAVAVLGLVIVPITGAFIAMSRSTAASKKRLDVSGDAQRIGLAWTRDVQSVDPEGVGLGACTREDTTNQRAEQVLVTFVRERDARIGNDATTTSSTAAPTTTTTPSGVGTVLRRSTWVVVGLGVEMKLVRRECLGEDFVSEATLADSFGVNGENNVTNVIYGKSGIGTPGDFCKADADNIGRSCQISVKGTMNYTINVTRRVPTASAADPVPPGAPIGLTGYALSTKIVASWTPPPIGVGQPTPTKYRVLAFDNAAGSGSPVGTGTTTDGTQTSVEVPGLQNNAPYWILAQATNTPLASTPIWGPASALVGPFTPQAVPSDAPLITSVSNGEEPGNGRTVKVTLTTPTSQPDGSTTWTGMNFYAEPVGGGPLVGPIYVAMGSLCPGTCLGLSVSNVTIGNIIPYLTSGTAYQMGLLQLRLTVVETDHAA